MTTLDENTKTNIRSAVYVLGFVIAVVMGYFYTLADIKKSVADVEARVLVLEKDQLHADTFRQDTKKRLETIDSNQVKMLVALGVEPEKPNE